jgi:hypothetical protein
VLGALIQVRLLRLPQERGTLVGTGGGASG